MIRGYLNSNQWINDMQPVTLQQLLKANGIETINFGIVVHTQPTWAVPGESHLSYTTLTRLVECCREHHWNEDVTPYLPSPIIDSICKSINAQFLQPVPISTTINITYKILQVRRKGYELLFKICSANMQETYAIFNAVFVFINTETKLSVIIPKAIANNLVELLHRNGSEQSEDENE